MQVFRTRTTAAAALAFFFVAVHELPAAPPLFAPGLGGNLSQVADYGREVPFVDIFRLARTWISQETGKSWGQGPALDLDSNGWIRSLAAGQYAETIILDNALGGQPWMPASRYTVFYEGQGTIAFDNNSATIVSQTAGRMVVTVPPGQNGIYLMVTATNPKNYLRNIHMVISGYENTYQTSPFNPVFLARLSIYKVLRMMEWGLTNGSTLQNWADRPTTSDYTYTWRGVPVEVMIQLANTLNVTPWFNIPAEATNDYVNSFSALVAKELNAGLKFCIEYSNETWNGSFSQNAWIRQKGLSEKLSTDPTIAGIYWTSTRAVQIFGLAEKAAPGRVIRVMASQAANSWISGQLLSYHNAAAQTDVLAIAPYFNCDDSASGGFGMLGDPATAAQVDAMNVTAVLGIALAHINGCAFSEMQSNAQVAKQYGVSLVAYEGGQSLVGFGSAQGDPVMAALFEAANRDPRMATLYAQYFSNWQAAGGGMFVHYSDVTSYTQFGSWGALEYQDQTAATSPKYGALTQFSAAVNGPAPAALKR